MKNRKCIQLVANITNLFFVVSKTHTYFFDSTEIAFTKKSMSSIIKKTDFQIFFGKQVEKFRIEQNFSYRQLAQRCDIDHSNISKIEKGEINIQLSTILQLSQGLNIHPKELFDFDFDLEKLDIHR
ncbi:MULTISPECIES: helix-turn-helix domain-containing protein [Flavobacterium]|nr:MULTISPECIES: helix-turn-helix transcriptional regulator [Flavobacterium]